MKSRALSIFGSALIVLSAFFFASGLCVAEEEASQFVAQPVTISKLSGKVEVLPKDAFIWEEAKIGVKLSEGDKIRTAEGAKAQLTLQDGSFINLKEKTTIGVKTAREGVTTGSSQYNLDFRVGEIMAELKKLKKGSSFEVETPTAVGAVRGTTFYMRTGIEVIDGVEQPFTDVYMHSDDILHFTNIVSGETHYVHQGQDSSSYGDGTTETPETIPPAAQDVWRSGWEIEKEPEKTEEEMRDEEEEEEKEEKEEESKEEKEEAGEDAEERVETEDKTQEVAKEEQAEEAEADTMTNAQLASTLVNMLGLEMPADVDKLSEAEFFEVQANMLAERGITLFIDADLNMLVIRGNIADVLYDALIGPTTAITEDKIDYLADLGYMSAGAADEAMNSGEIIDSLNVPSLSEAVAEAYSPPGEAGVGEAGPEVPGPGIPPAPASPEPETPASPIY